MFSPAIQAVISRTTAAPATSCQVLINKPVSDDYWTVYTDTNQKIKNSASIEVCKIVLELYKQAGQADQPVHLELWPTVDKSGSQIGGDSATVTVTATAAGTTYDFTWASYPNPTGDFYIHVVPEDSPSYLKIRANSDPTYYEDTSYDLYLNGADTNYDAAFSLYTIQ